MEKVRPAQHPRTSEVDGSKSMSDEIIPYSDIAQSVKLGIYKHFKGGEYELLGIARHSEDLTHEFAVYKSFKTGYLWVRPLQMFLENVDRDGYNGPRFMWLREKV